MLNVEFSQALYTWPKSSSSTYKSFTCLNHNNLAFKVERSAYLHNSASTIIFSLSCFYFITYENIFMNSTQLTCPLRTSPGKISLKSYNKKNTSTKKTMIKVLSIKFSFLFTSEIISVLEK
jgi:hypothetical protein